MREASRNITALRLSSLIALKLPRLCASGDLPKSWHEASHQHFAPRALAWLTPRICMWGEIRNTFIKHQMPGKHNYWRGSLEQLAEQTQQWRCLQLINSSPKSRNNHSISLLDPQPHAGCIPSRLYKSTQTKLYITRCLFYFFIHTDP